jgi:hypothetical protein
MSQYITGLPGLLMVLGWQVLSLAEVLAMCPLQTVAA